MPVEVLIADSWIMSANRLNATDGRRCWEFYARFKENPAHPSLSLERLSQARDSRNTWSGRISQGLRAIIHQSGDERAVLYAGQHDDAYTWARTHMLERHSVTGTIQIVESPDTMEAALPAVQPRQRGLFAAYADAYLLSLGVPDSWLPVMRKVVDADQLLEIVDKLPEDVQGRLLELADGRLVTPPAPISPDRPPLESADAQRHFYILAHDEELARILAEPLASWVVFLHPSQRRLAYGTFRGPLKVTGSAGTGKTVVGLHRAKHLVSQGKRVFLTTFGNELCDTLQASLKLLCTRDEMARITVSTVHSQAVELAKSVGARLQPIPDEKIRERLQAQMPPGLPLDIDGLQAEWDSVIEAQDITTWEAYRSASRAGRGTALTMAQRKAIWDVVAVVQEDLARQNSCSFTGLCSHARLLLRAGKVSNPFDAVIVDEVQDLSPQDLRFLAELAGSGADGLTIVGDGGQRIYRQAASMRSLGIDVRGRSHVLRLNYRTTEQIRRFAEHILHSEADDLDEGRDDRRGVRNLLRGPEPSLHGFSSADEQVTFVVKEIERGLASGRAPEEIAVFARRRDPLRAVGNRLHALGLAHRTLRGEGQTGVVLGSMYSAKGLEFKVVFVIDAADDRIPLPSTYRNIQDQQVRDEALRKEMHLLYVSVTRARDEVHISWVGEKSRFLT